MVGPRKIAAARGLRRKSTDAERKLWARLRNRQLDGLKFKRQVAIDRFVVDFACLEQHLVVELDGGQHGFHRAALRDADRTAVLEAMGYVVMRFGNGDVLADPDSVMMTILDQVHRLDPSTGPPFPQERPIPPHPSPLGSPSARKEAKPSPLRGEGGVQKRVPE